MPCAVPTDGPVRCREWVDEVLVECHCSKHTHTQQHTLVEIETHKLRRYFTIFRLKSNLHRVSMIISIIKIEPINCACGDRVSVVVAPQVNELNVTVYGMKYCTRVILSVT